jgi:small multidrug resistance family-3 protein
VDWDIKKIRKILITLFFFLLAGLCEIGGGYLVWLWLREDMSWILGAIGGFILFLYGIVPTFQPSYSHRIYAAYGGIFIVMALLWGLIFEGIVPDMSDVIGAAMACAGVAIIYMHLEEEKKNCGRIISLRSQHNHCYSSAILSGRTYGNRWRLFGMAMA